MNGSRRFAVLLLAVLSGATLSGCGGGTNVPNIGSSYEDPQHAYTIRVDPAWEIQVDGFAEGIEIWFLGPAADGFRPNLNLLTQAARGLSLADYTSLSIKAAPSQMTGFTLVSQAQLDPDLELMDYTGTLQGRQLHFLAVFGVRSDRAVIATLTATSATFATWRARAEPFMRTLRLT